MEMTTFTQTFLFPDKNKNTLNINKKNTLRVEKGNSISIIDKRNSHYLLDASGVSTFSVLNADRRFAKNFK